MADMSNDILGMMIAGLAALLLGYGLRHALSRYWQVPNWALPAVVGAAMFSYSVWNEYTWYQRVTAQLPESVVVLGTGAGGKAWRPWSFVVPVITRFRAVDLAPLASQDGDTPQAPIYFVERWRPTKVVMARFDCAESRMALVSNDGQVSTWSLPDPSEPAIRAVCRR